MNAPGFYNAANQYSDSQTKCPEGYVCQPDMIDGRFKTSQLSCPKGTFGVTSGAASEHLQCDYCSLGFYCDEGTDSSSKITCPKGYICPTGTSGKLQNACPAGFYNPSTGGVSLSILSSNFENIYNFLIS